MSYYLGVDLGGTNMVSAVVRDDSEVIAKAVAKTCAPREEESICQDMERLCHQVLTEVGLRLGDVPYLGIGVPGAVNRETGVVEFATNLYIHNWPLKERMKQFHPTVYVENDANAAALAECIAGAAKGARDAVTITLGTGVGSGMIIDGKIYSGVNCNGGEVGHMVIEYNGVPCTCGRRGCFERYASASGLVRMTKEALERQENPEETMIFQLVAGDLAAISGRTAFEAMKNGDPLGKEIVEEYLAYLGCGVVNLVNILQPEVLCIAGGISKEGETLLRPLREIVQKERYSKHSERQTKICAARLRGDAGVIGAAFLGRGEQ